jgi:hypothetical protein
MPRRTRAGAHDWAAEGHGWVWRGRSLRRVAYFASVDPEAGLEASREGELGDTSGRGEASNHTLMHYTATCVSTCVSSFGQPPSSCCLPVLDVFDASIFNLEHSRTDTDIMMVCNFPRSHIFAFGASIDTDISSILKLSRNGQRNSFVHAG